MVTEQKTLLLFQHKVVYREVSLLDFHYSFVIVYDRNWLAFKNKTSMSSKKRYEKYLGHCSSKSNDWK